MSEDDINLQQNAPPPPDLVAANPPQEDGAGGDMDMEGGDGGDCGVVLGGGVGDVFGVVSQNPLTATAATSGSSEKCSTTLPVTSSPESSALASAIGVEASSGFPYCAALGAALCGPALGGLPLGPYNLAGLSAA